MQPWHLPFPISNPSVIPCPVLTVASWSTYRFLRRQGKVVWYSHLFKNSPQFVVIHTVFSIVNEVEVDVFLELISPWSSYCWQFDLSVSAASFKPSLYIWRSSILTLLKPFLKDFEHNPADMWNELNCTVVWTFFCIALLWDWNKNWHCCIFKFDDILCAALQQQHLLEF